MTRTQQKIEKVADQHLRSLVRESGMPLTQFSEAIGWKSSQTLDWWSGRGEHLGEANVESLAQFLGISSEGLAEGSYDLALIRQRLLGEPTTLPEAYSAHASSYVRTSAHIIEYLSMLYGREFMDNILRSLDIHPLFFDNLENKINLNFFINLFNKLSQVGLSDEEISSLACYIFLSLRDTEMGKKFRSAKDHQESYSILAENATLFETNFEYDFQIDSKRIRIIAKPTDASLFLEEKSPEEYKRLFLYRANVFGWFPTLSNLSPLKMVSSKCFLKGDTCTVYETATPPGKAELELLRGL